MSYSESQDWKNYWSNKGKNSFIIFIKFPYLFAPSTIEDGEIACEEAFSDLFAPLAKERSITPPT